jgi:hypothetical protein
VQWEIKKVQDSASDVHASQTQLPWHATLVHSLSIPGRLWTISIVLSQAKGPEGKEGRGRCGVRVEVVGPWFRFGIDLHWRNTSPVAPGSVNPATRTCKTPLGVFCEQIIGFGVSSLCAIG